MSPMHAQYARGLLFFYNWSHKERKGKSVNRIRIATGVFLMLTGFFLSFQPGAFWVAGTAFGITGGTILGRSVKNPTTRVLVYAVITAYLLAMTLRAVQILLVH